jgi:hypothetical protein
MNRPDNQNLHVDGDSFLLALDLIAVQVADIHIPSDRK